MEIERKFILNSIPNIEYTQSYLIIQGYLAMDANGEVRIRSINDNYFFMTYKSIGDMSRQEVEYEITKELFHKLIHLCEDRKLSKFRHVGILPRDPKFFNIKIDVDLYIGKHNELIIGEIEFVTEEEAKSFNPYQYDWIEQEVTDDPSFKNRNLI